MAFTWSHATNSLDRINEAIKDPRITAIECDVMLGVAKEGGTTFYETPILAHPPKRESDISFATLLIRATKKNNGARVIQKHLKLDFKEIEVVESSLELLEMTKLANPLGKTIFFNADILSGPGRRNDKSVPAKVFLENCLSYIRSRKVRTFAKLEVPNPRLTKLTPQDKNIFFSLSLGYKCDWSCGESYEKDDVRRMTELARQFKLTSESGIGKKALLTSAFQRVNE